MYSDYETTFLKSRVPVFQENPENWEKDFQFCNFIKSILENVDNPAKNQCSSIFGLLNSLSVTGVIYQMQTAFIERV